MLIKKYVYDDEPDAPEIDPVAARRGIVNSLYKRGRYEQWCKDYGKDPRAYWREIFGTDYAAHDELERITQVLREPARKPGFLARLFGGTTRQAQRAPG